MAEAKRFYWIKLKESFFINNEVTDWIISQPNGCEYIVLYLKLCLLTANKGGRLAMEIGEMIIPYDAQKIAADTKFDIDTVIVAMELFRKIGFIYEEEDGILKIPYVEEIVGSETPAAERMRKSRAKKSLSNAEKSVTLLQNCSSQCYIEKDKDIRDKEIKILDSDEEQEREEKADEPPGALFTPPTLEEVESYCFERNNNIDAQRFIDYYTSNGWKVGQSDMQDWKATIRNWERRDEEKAASRQKDKPETNNPFLGLLMEGDTL